MALDKKLDLINNIFGLVGVLYTVIVIIITFIFKENSQRILVVAAPVFLLLAIMIVLAFLVVSYFKQRFAEIIHLHERLKKLEETQALDARLRNIEERLIKQEHGLENMGKSNFRFALHKKGNTAFLYTLLAILLLALLVWLVIVLRTG